MLLRDILVNFWRSIGENTAEMVSEVIIIKVWELHTESTRNQDHKYEANTQPHIVVTVDNLAAFLATFRFAICQAVSEYH